MKAKVSEFVKYLLEQVGNAYLWGGQGETVYGLIRDKAKKNSQDDSKTDSMLNYMKSKGVKDLKMYDCSGLGVRFLLDKNVIKSDMTADMLYRSCSKIDENKIREGDMGFLVNSSGKATHVGYFVGNGIMVHALNQKVGVIKEDVFKRNWKFGRPDKYLEYDLASDSDIDDLKVGDKTTTNKSILIYNNANNAENKTNPVTSYPAGTYYVYKIHGGCINISRKKGIAGGWVTKTSLSEII